MSESVQSASFVPNYASPELRVRPDPALLKAIVPCAIAPSIVGLLILLGVALTRWLPFIYIGFLWLLVG
jgi:hypothetical protein